MSASSSTRHTRRPLLPHPTRDLIVDTMRAYGRGISPKRLSAITGITIGSMAYHIRTLHSAGVIKLVDERRVRGAIEHFYELDPDYESDLNDPFVGLQKFFGFLTLPPDTEGGYPELIELDEQAREELLKVCDALYPQVERIVKDAADRQRKREPKPAAG
jgi:DNA-binding transcriptional ArsR family regulator